MAMAVPSSVWDRIRSVDRFFQENDPVHKTMRRIVKQLTKAKIPYAIVGGMAVNVHGHQRTTDDLDVLLTADGLAEFRKRFVPKYYETHPRLPRRFTDRKNEVTIDFLLTGLYPGNGRPGPICFPDPAAASQTIEEMQVLDLATLIQLKLAARRHQDFADVISLIRAHQLDESFGDRLHPSVRSEYIECLEEKRREDEYEARQLGEGES
jgi:aminoglycoside-2''-adenylyltransferase